MVSVLQPTQADSTQSHPLIPVGVDCGAGLVKICIDSRGSQMRLRQPSKVLELKTALIDDLSSKEGGQFFYHSGDRTNLIDREFLTGELAASVAPTTHIKLSDDPALKAEYCLHTLLGALATLPYRQEWNLFLVISTHSHALFNNKLKELTSGVHTVSFGGKNKPQVRVNITVGAVTPEGAGSYAYAKRLNIIDPSAHVIGFDFGTSTVIPQVFAPGGKLIYHEPLEAGGCIDLLEAIASDPELLRFLGTGKPGNLELIRKGIESGEFIYGTRNFNLRPVYARHVKPWLADRLRLGLKATQEWLDSAESLVAWGGGSQMSGVSRMLSTQRIKTVPDGCWANAIGLQVVAAALLARRA